MGVPSTGGASAPSRPARPTRRNRSVWPTSRARLAAGARGPDRGDLDSARTEHRTKPRRAPRSSPSGRSSRLRRARSPGLRGPAAGGRRSVTAALVVDRCRSCETTAAYGRSAPQRTSRWRYGWRYGWRCGPRCGAAIRAAWSAPVASSDVVDVRDPRAALVRRSPRRRMTYGFRSTDNPIALCLLDRCARSIRPRAVK